MNNIIYDPNYIPSNAIYMTPNNESRIIPFLGGAIIGGLGGAAIANNNQYGGYYPQQVSYPPQGYYYPMNGYYYYPNYGYPVNTNQNIKGSN